MYGLRFSDLIWIFFPNSFWRLSSLESSNTTVYCVTTSLSVSSERFIIICIKTTEWAFPTSITKVVLHNELIVIIGLICTTLLLRKWSHWGKSYFSARKVGVNSAWRTTDPCEEKFSWNEQSLLLLSSQWLMSQISRSWNLDDPSGSSSSRILFWQGKSSRSDPFV